MAGVGLGGACGYAVGVGANREAPVEKPSDAPAPSGDAQLDELRRIAVSAPIEELVEKRDAIIHFATGAYPRDEYLWQGIERLAKATLIGHAIPNRRPFAMWLAQFIERGDQRVAGRLTKYVTDLRKVK